MEILIFTLYQSLLSIKNRILSFLINILPYIPFRIFSYGVLFTKFFVNGQNRVAQKQCPYGELLCNQTLIFLSLIILTFQNGIFY